MVSMQKEQALYAKNIFDEKNQEGNNSDKVIT